MLMSLRSFMMKRLGKYPQSKTKSTFIISFAPSPVLLYLYLWSNLKTVIMWCLMQCGSYNVYWRAEHLLYCNSTTVYLTQFNLPLALQCLVDFYFTMKLKSNWHPLSSIKGKPSIYISMNHILPSLSLICSYGAYLSYL